ncbi:enoyl-CoA hydratase/isomerase family protein [Thermodesulfobacteriota bacterium]
MQESSVEREKNPWEEDRWEKGYPYEYFKYNVDRKEKIATVTMTNPTGIDTAPNWDAHELRKLIDKWERDDDVKVVILKSAGKNFCTGHDLDTYLTEERGKRNVSKAEAAKSKKKFRRTNRGAIIDGHQHPLFERLLYSLKPTIVQVHGLCIEYGMGLHMHCDMTIAGDDAHFGHLGQVIGMSGVSHLQLYLGAMGYKRCREMMTCGRTYNARQAVEMGMVNRVVPREKLDEEVWNEAKRIALIPLDGLVTGKMHMRLALEEMGLTASNYRTQVIWAGFMPNVKHEPGEFHFFDVLREKGLKEALRQRKEVYAPLGGFGRDDERDFIVEE